MKTTLTLIFMTLAVVLKSQNSVNYQYDANGNRIKRAFIGMRISPTLPGKDSTAKDSTKIIEDNRATAIKHGVSIYPNPTKDAVCISINKAGENSAETNKKTVIHLMSNAGTTVAQQKYAGEVNTFNLNNQPAGEYYIRIIFNEAESVTYKIVKIN